MPVPGVRTLVVAVLAAAVAVRVTATQPLTGAYARIAPDPAGALSSAADGWTVAGSLGDATAQGLREVPLAVFLWLTDVLGMAPANGRTAWSVLVLVLAAVGAVRLARARVSTPARGRRAGRPGWAQRCSRARPCWSRPSSTHRETPWWWRSCPGCSRPS